MKTFVNGNVVYDNGRITDFVPGMRINFEV
jgi:hypothetical protein